MTLSAAKEPEDFYTLEAYLALESSSGIRHEWVANRVIAMSGGSRRHDLAAAWIANAFFAAFTPRGCAVFSHNRKLRVENVIYYPDVFVQCGSSDAEQFEASAQVVVEVLSPDSLLRDRREKAVAYARLDGLTAYSVVDPDSARIEVYAPKEGQWAWRVYGPGMHLPLGELDLDVDQLYDYLTPFA